MLEPINISPTCFCKSGFITPRHVRHLYTAHGMAIYDFMTSIKGAQSVAQLIQTHENPIEALVLEQIRPNYEKYIYAHLDAEN